MSFTLINGNLDFQIVLASGKRVMICDLLQIYEKPQSTEWNIISIGIHCARNYWSNIEYSIGNYFPERGEEMSPLSFNLTVITWQSEMPVCLFQCRLCSLDEKTLSCRQPEFFKNVQKVNMTNHPSYICLRIGHIKEKSRA